MAAFVDVVAEQRLGAYSQLAGEPDQVATVRLSLAAAPLLHDADAEIQPARERLGSDPYALLCSDQPRRERRGGGRGDGAGGLQDVVQR